MATSPGLFFWQDKIGRNNPHVVQFLFQITAAKTVSQLPQGTPTLTSFDAIASQATIDDFLGTTNEFLAAQFDAVSMGVDAFACICNFGGQGDALYAVEAYVDDLTTRVEKSLPSVATLTSSSLTNQCAVGANGNLAVRLVMTGLDALTSGIISVRFLFKSK
jgi:hypothetical protein